MPGRSAAPRSHCHRDSPQRSAARGSGSSRRARAVPVPDHADLQGRRPGVRQSPAVARWPTAARSRHPKSTDRRRKRCARVCPSPMANRVESPYFLPWRGRTPLASIDPASATKSYTKPKVYLPPASPLMQPGELFGSRLPSTFSWILRYYLPEIAEIFRTKPMPRNRVQHQKGLSDDAFEQLYPDEEACRKAWFAWRWPEGFKYPRCAGSNYCEIRGRQLLQCRLCRHQTSLIAGTVLQGTKLPMRVWFRAMHLLAQGKKGLSNIELGRRLGISTNAAWRVQHKLMQADDR